MTPGNRKRLGEFLILLIYLIIEGYGLWDITWPLPHFWALAAGVAGVVALLFLYGAFSEKQIAVYAGTATLCCIGIYLIAPRPLPFHIEYSGILWEVDDRLPKIPNPNGQLNVVPVSRGWLITGSANKSIMLQGVDILMHLAITNRSAAARRITGYKLAVSSLSDDLWTPLCNIDFNGVTELYSMGDKKTPRNFHLTGDFLDKQLTAHAMQPGDTVSGWAGWICPLSDEHECRPNRLKFTLDDSLGEHTQYILSIKSGKTKVTNDWMELALFSVPQLADRDFTNEHFMEGNCPPGGGTILPIPTFP